MWAHLVALETRGAADARGRAKVALIRGLYQRGFARERVLDLLRLIDWLLAVPPEVERDVWRTLEALEKEQEMPYVTSFERIGRAAGLVEGQRALLRRMIEHRFGTMPEDLDRRIAAADQAELEELADRLLAAPALEDLLAGA